MLLELFLIFLFNHFTIILNKTQSLFVIIGINNNYERLGSIYQRA